MARLRREIEGKLRASIPEIRQGKREIGPHVGDVDLHLISRGRLRQTRQIHACRCKRTESPVRRSHEFPPHARDVWRTPETSRQVLARPQSTRRTDIALIDIVTRGAIVQIARRTVASVVAGGVDTIGVGGAVCCSEALIDVTAEHTASSVPRGAGAVKGCIGVRTKAFVEAIVAVAPI